MSRQISALCIALLTLSLWSAETVARPDFDAGKREFNRSCRGCHSLQRGEVIEGPSLAGVIGRRAGSLTEYNYSEAMKNSNIIWTESTLDTYLASPLTELGSGIDMMSHGVRDDDLRANLIEYLKHAP